jgi:PAS domain S-box-containing protein
MNDALCILLIDDNPDDRLLIIRELRREFPNLRVKHVTDAESFDRALEMGDFNLAITDYQLRWSDGLAILRSLKTRYPHCPVIMFTATGSEEIAVEAMKSGLDDYVLKSPKHLSRLRASVRLALERARQRRELEMIERRYQSLFDNVPVGLYRSTPEGKILEANQTMVRMLGYPDRESLLQVNALELYVNPEDRKRWLALLERERIVKNFEAQFRRYDGTVIWVRNGAKVIHDEEGHLLYFEGRLEDITEYRRMEEELRESERRYRLLAENVTDIIWTMDLNLRLTYVSPSVTLALGYSAEEVMNLGVEKILTPTSLQIAIKTLEEELSEENAGRRKPFRSRTMELEFIRKDGAMIWTETKANLLYGSDGRPIGILGVTRDITERKKLEMQFLQAQKMEALGRLAGGVAHDFNNLLTAIIGNADLLLLKLNPNNPDYEKVKLIKETGMRAAHLAQQLLAFSRRQVMEPVILDLNSLIQEMGKMFTRLLGEDIECHFNLDPELKLVKADPGQIEQVILNLVVNAGDAMPDGGSLTITTGNVFLDREYCYLHPDVTPGEYALIAISDTGCGIPPDVIEHIFEPFYTTKPSGSGLGLSTVYGIVKQLGGHISVYSDVGQGTTFKIFLPIIEGGISEESPKGVAQEPMPKGNETILIVEDEDAVRDLIVVILKGLGYKVFSASCVEEAQGMMRDCEGTIDLLLSDIVLPDGRGPDLAVKLKKIYPELKVIFMSGYAGERLGGVDIEEVHFLSKPFTVSTLASKVREILSS